MSFLLLAILSATSATISFAMIQKAYVGRTLRDRRTILFATLELGILMFTVAASTTRLRLFILGGSFAMFTAIYLVLQIRQKTCNCFGTERLATGIGVAIRAASALVLISLSFLHPTMPPSGWALGSGIVVGAAMGCLRLFTPGSSSGEQQASVGPSRLITRRSLLRNTVVGMGVVAAWLMARPEIAYAEDQHEVFCRAKLNGCKENCISWCYAPSCSTRCDNCYTFCVNWGTNPQDCQFDFAPWKYG
jgi:hypothetical protein